MEVFKGTSVYCFPSAHSACFRYAQFAIRTSMVGNNAVS